MFDRSLNALLNSVENISCRSKMKAQVFLMRKVGAVADIALTLSLCEFRFSIT